MAAKKKADAKDGGTTETKKGKPALRKNKAAEKKSGLAGDIAPGPSVDHGLFIVGIGTSAGGLNALERLFEGFPSNSGMAFVIVIHLDPTHATLLPELLQKHTGMKVGLVEEETRVEPNQVYIIPPNKTLAISQGTLHIFPRNNSLGSRLPIDSFFHSLAEDQGFNAVGIVLSGTGADGSSGIKAIKAEGGTVIIQDPKSAKYDGMPISAVATGMADFVLAPEQMPAKLISHIKGESKFGAGPALPSGNDSAVLAKILTLLRDQTGHDFMLYKQKTVWRRILRRMSICQIGKASAYANYLETNRQEIKYLFGELLIGVTNFFRDPDAFEIMKTKVLPELLKDKPDGYAVRVWVPACASGEEAYSLAILIKECMIELGKRFSVQVFGTDIDTEAIEIARKGVYPLSIAENVTAERLEANFINIDHSYRVKKEIRELMVFALQDVTKDPPFIRLDLVSCRNLLIYLEPELQKKIIPAFHYSLKSGGGLFLGFSETIGGFKDLFEPVDKKWKIYRRIGQLSRFPTLEVFPHMVPAAPQATMPEPAREKPLPLGYIQRALLDNFVPPCLMIDQLDTIVYIHGKMGRYLEPASGTPSFNIMELVRPGLRNELAAALRLARAKKAEVVHKNLKIDSEGPEHRIDLRVRPLAEADKESEMVLVVFAPVPLSEEAPLIAETKLPPRDARKKIQELEHDLKYTKADLEITIEELQSANEELKSANEEMQSSNEELQSSNEEMETSKEELQSLNEELVTVNTELQTKMEELAHINNDIKNFFDATSAATIFVDSKICVKRFTPKSTQLINLIESDIGRPLSDLSTNLLDADLVGVAQRVLDNLVFEEHEVRDKNNLYYLMRVIPYRTFQNIIEGVVISFIDITERKRVEMEAREARQLADGIVETVEDPLLVIDSNMWMVSANRAFFRIFGLERRDVEKSSLYELAQQKKDIVKIRELMENILTSNEPLDNYCMELEFPSLGRKSVILNGREIMREIGKERLILLSLRDTDCAS